MGLGVVEGVLEGDDEAGGGASGGGHGGGIVLLAEIGAGTRNGVFYFQGFSSALNHWLCSSVHFHPGQRSLDTSCLSFHGMYTFHIHLQQ